MLHQCVLLLLFSSLPFRPPCTGLARIVHRKVRPHVMQLPTRAEKVVQFEDEPEDVEKALQDEVVETTERAGMPPETLSINGSAEVVTFTMDQPSTTRPVEDIPRGPILQEETLERKYAKKLAESAADKMPFYEPQRLQNCWQQAMLSSQHEFTPQCNPDGSFASKQCFLGRCWCTNRDGSAQIQSNQERFFVGIRGITLRCTQNGIPI